MTGYKLPVVILGALLVVYVSGHGMMMEPPNRSSMWRFFPDSPPNYNDNENFCGGFGYCTYFLREDVIHEFSLMKPSLANLLVPQIALMREECLPAVQWEVNKGRCGLCGDDFRLPRPRPNENLGIWGQGKVGRTYNSGQVIDIAILLTANHWGYFNFSICYLEDDAMTEPENCFHPLKLGDGRWTYEVPSKDKGYYNTTLQLPEVSCDRCVLRWWYTAGNTWGPCGDGTSDVGCGPQETFVSCSDISIV